MGLDFGDVATGLALGGARGFIKGELADRREEEQRNEKQRQEEEQRNEIQRRDDLVTHRQQTMEAIKQHGLNRRKEMDINSKNTKDGNTIVGRDENGFPIYKNKVEDYKESGGTLYDKGVTRDDKDDKGVTKKQLLDIEKSVGDGYSKYLDDSLEDDPLNREEWAKKFRPQAYDLLYGDTSPAAIIPGATPGDGTGKSAAAAMLDKLGKKSGKTFSKQGANQGRKQDMIPTDDSSAPLEAGDNPTDIRQPAPINFDMPVADSAEGAPQKNGGFFSKIMNGSFDLSDIFKGAVKGAKSGADLISGQHDKNMAALPQAKDELIVAAKEAAKAQGWTAEQFEKVAAKIAEGTIESIQWVINIMRADTDQREAYFAKA